MKNFNIFLALISTVLVVAACSFSPVVPQATFDVTATARAVTPAVPTVTPEPTATAEVVPTVAAVDCSVATAATPDCPIKGNIDAKGVKIYHLPGDPNYAKTKAEAYFATAADAEAAGYRSIQKKK